MKAYIKLATGYGKALNAQTVSSVEYYEGVDIYDAEGVLIEKCRYFPIGDLGSPKPVPDGLKAFFAREFPASATVTGWTITKRKQWYKAAEGQVNLTDMTKAEIDAEMVIRAEELNYPMGRDDD